MRAFGRFGNGAGRLADDLDQLHEGVLVKLAGAEAVFVQAGALRLHLPGGVQHVEQVGGVTIHK
jgi:hypothetical protein